MKSKKLNDSLLLALKKKWMASLLFIFLFISDCNADALYYRIPFRMQTYTPVTSEEIKRLAEEGGMQKLLSANHDKLFELLGTHNEMCKSFDKKNIRIYIREHVREYFIDNQGIVSLKDNKFFKCSLHTVNEYFIVKLLNDGNTDRWDAKE